MGGGGPDVIIACAAVAEELRPMGVEEKRMVELSFGLHVEPAELRRVLQEKIDSLPGGGVVALGYGLCSNAVVGLSSSRRRLVIPRVDDCISLFLGSREEYLRRLREEPGTYFLTKGWIETADTPYYRYHRLVERHGREKAGRIMRMILSNYRRIVLINTGNYRLDEYRRKARGMAEALGLDFEEIPGSNRLLRMMVEGEWGSEFVVVEPGETVTLSRFME
jgi:hypothetical protein